MNLLFSRPLHLALTLTATAMLSPAMAQLATPQALPPAFGVLSEVTIDTPALLAQMSGPFEFFIEGPGPIDIAVGGSERLDRKATPRSTSAPAYGLSA